jgi:hypothetical protein
VEPPTPGVMVTRTFDGSTVELDVTINPAHTRPEKRNRTTVRLRTNVGEAEVPVTFRQRVTASADDPLLDPPRASTIGWTLGFGVVAALVMWQLGSFLAVASPVSDTGPVLALNRAAAALASPGELVLGWSLLGFLVGGWVGCFLALRRSRKRIRQWALVAVTLLVGIGLSGGDPASVPDPAVDPVAQFEVVVTAAGLNVRAAPNTGAAVLGEARRGMRLRVVGAQDDWYQIAIREGGGWRTAWVSQSFVRRVDGGEPPPRRQPTGPASASSPPVARAGATTPGPAPASDPPEELVRALRGLLTEGALRSGRGEFARASQAYSALRTEIDRMAIDHPRSPQLQRLRQDMAEAVRASQHACAASAEQAILRGESPEPCG